MMKHSKDDYIEMFGVAACIGILLVAATLSIGCGQSAQGQSNVPARFETVYEQGGMIDGVVAILRDKETGRDYLFYKVGYGAGLCLLEDGRDTK